MAVFKRRTNVVIRLEDGRRLDATYNPSRRTVTVEGATVADRFLNLMVRNAYGCEIASIIKPSRRV